MNTFGDRLKYLRQRKNLKQSELGELLGLSGSAVGSWEREVRQPDLETVGRLARELDVSTDYLLGLTDEVSQENGRATDLRTFLHDSEVMFAGIHLSERDKERIMDILRGLFYDALKEGR